MTKYDHGGVECDLDVWCVVEEITNAKQGCVDEVSRESLVPHVTFAMSFALGKWSANQNIKSRQCNGSC